MVSVGWLVGLSVFHNVVDCNICKFLSIGKFCNLQSKSCSHHGDGSQLGFTVGSPGRPSGSLATRRSPDGRPTTICSPFGDHPAIARASVNPIHNVKDLQAIRDNCLISFISLGLKKFVTYAFGSLRRLKISRAITVWNSFTWDEVVGRLTSEDRNYKVESCSSNCAN